MNSLPTDLLNLITYHLSTSESIFFGFKVKDCQEYIDVFGDDERFKIALKQKDIKWIHETRSKVHPVRGLKNALKYGCFWLIDYFINSIPNSNRTTGYWNDKYNDTVCGYLYITGHISLIKQLSNAEYRYPHYICGKRGIVDIMNDKVLTNNDTRHRGGYNFVEGLAVGQHKELFDKYAPYFVVDRYTYKSYLMLFNDEQFIIDRLNMFEQKLLAKLIQRKLFRVASLYLQHCDYKLQNLLHINNVYDLDNTPLYQLFLKKKISMVKDFVGSIDQAESEIVKVYVFITCLNSDIEGLDFIYDHYDNHELLLKYVELYCMSDAIYTHTQLEIPKNTKLFMLIDRLRPYIDECIDKYIIFENLAYSTSAVDVIIFQVLVYCYAEHNNMKAIRELFQIAIDYFDNQTYPLINILYYKELIHDGLLRRTNSYRHKKLLEVQTEANMLGIQIDGLDKERLVIEIFKTRILL